MRLAQQELDMDDLFFPVVERPLTFTSPDGRHHGVPTHKALVRSHPTDRNIPVVLSVVGVDYELVPHKQYYDAFEDALYKRFPADSVTVRSQRAYLGQRVRRTYRIEKVNKRLAKVGEVVAFKMYAANSYGGASLRYGWMTEVLACMNLAVLSADKEAVVKRHTSGLSLEGIGDDFERFLASYDASVDRMRRWPDLLVTKEMAEALLDAFPGSSKSFNKFIIDHYITEHELPMDFWRFFNVMTSWATHSRIQPPRNTREDNKHAVMWTRQERVRTWINSPEVKALIPA